ncbi:hypothetical protein C1Y18_35635, partial [Pseudomonas sp. MPR-R5A]
NPTPFTIGLKLEEPAELDDSWELSIFLRGKADPDIFVDFKDYSNYPLNWHDYEDDIEKEFKRWIQVFPWLQGEKNKLTTQLTEDE